MSATRVKSRNQDIGSFVQKSADQIMQFYGWLGVSRSALECLRIKIVEDVDKDNNEKPPSNGLVTVGSFKVGTIKLREDRIRKHIECSSMVGMYKRVAELNNGPAKLHYIISDAHYQGVKVRSTIAHEYAHGVWLLNSPHYQPFCLDNGSSKKLETISNEALATFAEKVIVTNHEYPNNVFLEKLQEQQQEGYRHIIRNTRLHPKNERETSEVLGYMIGNAAGYGVRDNPSYEQFGILSSMLHERDEKAILSKLVGLAEKSTQIDYMSAAYFNCYTENIGVHMEGSPQLFKSLFVGLMRK